MQFENATNEVPMPPLSNSTPISSGGGVPSDMMPSKSGTAVYRYRLVWSEHAEHAICQRLVKKLQNFYRSKNSPVFCTPQDCKSFRRLWNDACLHCDSFVFL